MKAFLTLVLMQSVFAAQLWSQAPTPTSSADRIVVALGSRHPVLVQYTPGMKFSEAVSASDFVGYANVIYIYLIRGGKKEKIVMRTLRSDPTKEPILEPWDILYLPPSIY